MTMLLNSSQALTRSITNADSAGMLIGYIVLALTLFGLGVWMTWQIRQDIRRTQSRDEFDPKDI